MSNERLSEDNRKLSEEIKGLSDKNVEDHDLIWQHEAKQDGRLDEHDKRITRLEDKP